MAELTKNQLEDKEFILHSKWPMIDYLPLRRSVEDDRPDVAFIYRFNKEKIYFENIFTFIDGDVILPKIPNQTYNSVEDLLNDGWYVD